MPASRLAFISAVVASFLTAGMLAAQVTTGPSPLEQRIQRIQDGIVPPVIVQGQSIQTTKLLDRMKALHIPGVSIAVIHDRKIEWARGYGVTRIDGLPVTTETLFQAASISKPVTALAALKLATYGRFKLDTDINEYLKAWKVPDNQFTATKKVTLRELLSHTAGITVHGFGGYAHGDLVPTLVQVLNGEKPANSPPIRVDVEPGTIWRYSGGGYVIVQQLLVDVTGKPFPQLMEELVLRPIGMVHSTYEQPLPENRLTEAAMPYDQNGRPVAGGPHTYPEMAPAGLWTTPSDLALYALKVQTELGGIIQGEKNVILTRAMVWEMVTPTLNNWGLGPETGGSGDHLYFTHGGANDGFRCNLVAYNNGDGAVIMTNSDVGGVIANEILRTIAYEYKWPDFQPAHRTIAKIDPKIFDSYVGSYRLAPNFTLTISRDGEHFFALATGQAKLEIFPESAHDFFTTSVDAKITFVTDTQGQATELILHQGGDQHAPRIQQ